jgi:MFS family permease
MQQQRAVALALGLLCSSCCLVGEAGASGWLGARASASRRGLPLHAGGGALGGSSSSSSSSSSCCSSRASTSERRRRARARAGAGIYAGRGEAASWRSSCSSAGPTIYALTGGGGGEDKQRRESPLLVALASTDSSTAGSGDGSRASREVLPRKLVDEEDQAITTMSTEGLAVMMVLCFLVALICALDRVAMSVAIIPMAGEYGYSPSTQGLIGSVFSWGYMCSMIPVGILGSFLSPKAVMAGGVLIWSVAQILSPLGAAAGLPWLLSFRFAMGAAEAVTVPLIQEIVGQIVPVSQKGRWLALILSGLQVGTVLAYVASPAVISAFEWPGLFEVYGAAGLVWIGLWLAFARDVPNQNRAMPLAVSEIELETLPRDLKNMEQKVTKSSRGLNFTTLLESLRDVPWAEIVRDKNICCIAAAHMAHNYGLYIILFYLPTFFSECGLSLSQSSGASVMPWIAGAVVGNAAGW